MKNIMTYILVVFSLIGLEFAQAQSCESKEVKLSQMKYVGADLTSLLKNPNDCSVVSAYNDTDASAQCRERKRAALNPGNPQYIGTDKHGGSTTSNTLGYYFCVNMSKHDMCDSRTSALSDSMEIKWQEGKTGRKSHNNGDCVCRRKGDSASPLMTCPTTPEQVDALKEGNSTGCSEFPNAEKDKVTGQCVCKIGPPRGVTANSEPCPTEPEKVVTETVDDNDFNDCFTAIKGAKEACSEAGQAAIAKCSKKAPEVNKNIQQAQRVLGIGLDTLVAKNAGTGALEACAKMSATGTGVIGALSLLKESCKKELDTCKKGCEDIKAYKQEDTNTMLAACKAKFEEKYKNNPEKKWLTPQHDNRFAELAQVYKDLAVNSEKLCKGDAQVADTELEDFIQELAQSVQKADICKCQLTAGSLGSGATKLDSCESIVTPLTCMQNINQPGCSYSSVGCPPGSTAVSCRTPVTAINPNGSGLAAPPSGFAGPGFGSAGGGNAGGKVQIGNDGLDGFFDETRPTGSGTATADGGSPFGVAMGGGAPGVGVNMGGDGAAGNGGNGEGSEKGGLSGFFQNAKGAISSMFGGGNSDKGTPAKAANNKAYKNDVNGFRPKAPALRGMANAGEFGGKNRDIWKIMNQRYNDQYHTFITVENPSK